MGRYILRRLLISIPIIFIITIIVFVLVEIAPGDMTDYFLSDEAIQYLTEADIQAIRVSLGMDASPPVRYIRWLGKVMQGDLGYSFIRNENVMELLTRRISNSIILMGTGLAMAIVIGIILGVFISLRQYSIWDNTLTGLSFIGISMPAFVAGIIGLYIFAIKIPIFPTGGMYSTRGDRGFLDLLWHLILPATILSIMHTARIMRYTRFSMLEVIKQDYIVTADAKGMKKRIIVYRHALKNALIPVITIIGLSIPMVIVGAIFLETIFNWPGMGTLYHRAVLSRDYPIIMGANLFIAFTVLIANLLVDIVYAIVDPRVRYE
jgi:peptide/nickel transport system permease protein